MKKFASVLLALVLCVAMAVPAFAADVITYNGGVSNHLLASNASTGTKTFTDYFGKEQTAYVYPVGTVISLNVAKFSLLEFNGISDAENPMNQLGLNFWTMKEFVPEEGIIYSVGSFDGSSFVGDTCYLTVEGGGSAPSAPPTTAEPERLPMPAVTNKPGKTTVQANNWTDGELNTMNFETLKVEKVSLPAPEGSVEYLVLVLKPGSQLPYIDCVSPVMFIEDGGYYVSDGAYPGPSGVAENAFAPDFPGAPAHEYVELYGTDYDLPVLISMKSSASEPEAPVETPTPTPSEEPVAPAEPDAPVEPAPSAEPETPAESDDPIAPAPSTEPEAPVEDQSEPTPAPSEKPESDTPAAPVEPVPTTGTSFPVGIVAAVVVVAVIAVAAVVVLKKKKT